MQLEKIQNIKINPNNPRLIKDDKFKKLVQSIKDFPEMLNIRPIVVNQEMIILGGNMRYSACKEAGLKEIPIIITDLTKEQQREFLIKDNISFGDPDWDILANEWNREDLEAWGFELDIPMENYEPIDLPDDFIKKFEDTKEIVNPIAIQIGECSELFLIPIYNKIDESFIRELFNLNETKQSKLIKGKSNVIDIEILKCKMK